jgi:subtilisin family serine protease
MRFATILLILLLSAVHHATAQDTERVIVQFRDDAVFNAFAADYADDERTAQQGQSTYHRRDVVGAAMALERTLGFRATNFYSRALKGFAATVTPAQRRALEASPLVQFVERETVIALDPDPGSTQIVPWGIPTIGADVSTARSGDGSGDIGGVTIYIIDTGVDPTHPDLNVAGHMSFVSGVNEDCHGHGTGVAGIAAARDNSMYSVGVAPGAPVYGVKVFTCGGLTLPSVIVQALDWVVANGTKPAVINMSLGNAIPILALNNAVRNAAANGFVVSVAAGNGNPFTGVAMDACRTSPAGAGYLFGIPNGIVTTAATDIADQEATFSNFGACVDLWAPGVDLSSTWLMSEGGMITASGTSFSAPYVAGAAALLLSRFPTLTPPLVELILRLTAEVPGTLSKDGATIRRLSVRLY